MSRPLIFGLLFLSACGGTPTSDDPDSGGASGSGGKAEAGGGTDAGQANTPLGGSGGAGSSSGGSSGANAAGSAGAAAQDFGRRLAVGFEYGCALKSDHTLVCWGTAESTPESIQAPAGIFRSVAALYQTSVALQEAGTGTVWGDQAQVLALPSGELFRQVALGAHHACGLRDDASIVCWGGNDFGERDAPPGEFAEVTVGFSHSCARTTAGPVFCWGDNLFHQIDSPVGGSFISISSGAYHSCAVKADGAVVCWGAGDADDPNDGSDPDAHGQSVAPEGTFKSVSAGYHHSCAIQADDSVTCWGAGTTSSNCENGEECGQADAPSGSFKELALGAKHSCGLTIADGLVCWGSDNFGRATPPQDFE